MRGNSIDWNLLKGACWDLNFAGRCCECKTIYRIHWRILVFDLVYRISCVSSAYVLKSDMDRCSPVDAVPKSMTIYDSPLVLSNYMRLGQLPHTSIQRIASSLLSAPALVTLGPINKYHLGIFVCNYFLTSINLHSGPILLQSGIMRKFEWESKKPPEAVHNSKGSGIRHSGRARVCTFHLPWPVMSGKPRT